MPPVSSVVAKWEIVAICRERRDELGMTGPAVAKAAGVSATFWSRFENEKVLVGTEKFPAVLAALEFPEDQRRHLLELREHAMGRGWWAGYNKIFSPQHINLYGLEDGAEEVRTYESVLFPGLLQTEAYARALIEADPVGIPAKEVQRRVAARMKRQQRLPKDDRQREPGEEPLRLVTVISEAVIKQQVGGPQVLRDQLHHVATTIRNNPVSIDLRIFPFERPPVRPANGQSESQNENGPIPILGGSTFHLLEFASSALGPLAWYETPLEAKIIEDPDKVFDLSRSFQHVQSQALNQADSLRLIEESAGKIDIAIE